ncbi:thiol protease/hemagglutinin PrtT [uncultured Bacteroides sp.]|uniref:thiol protease/hemagglutinin PrtT n=1 Tax=uncultured Bacteroides sp. TaxID=162156 RepID=UPI002AAB9BC5|nr:thiol protease/hemagglutinin PrtT [uncultured Bacteroides sp.]
MRRTIILLICFYLLISSGYSKPRTYSKAFDIANSFYQKASKVSLRKSVTGTSPLKFAYGSYKQNIATRSGSGNDAYYYVFNAGYGNGFVVVSGDDRVTEILGYSSSGDFSMDSIPSNFRSWLNIYQNELQLLMDNSTTSASTLESVSDNISTNSILPLLGQTKWNQGAPYNSLCPKNGGNSTYTGCVATAIAQIMRYHQYPTNGTGTKTYTSETISKALTVDFSATTYDWGNMVDKYTGNETDIQKNAVATLMYHCGVAANMDYGTSSSAAYDEDAAIGLINYLGYDPNLRTIYRDYYSADEWEVILKNELNSGRPVLYGGGNNNNGGHAFVCDGYDVNDLYHFNWGWNGYCDGYYALTSLKPNSTGTDAGSTAGGYTVAQDMTIGIQKPTSESKPSYQLLLNDESSMTFATDSLSNSSFSIFVPFYNGGITTYNGKTAVGLYQNSTLLAAMGETAVNNLAGFNNGYFEDKTINYSDLKLPANIENGLYQLYSIYMGNDEASWSKMRGLADHVSFFNIQVVDGNVAMKKESDTGFSNITNNNLIVYPGSTKDNIYLKSEKQMKSIRIIDITGKQVMLIQPLMDGEITVPVYNLNSGVYLIQITTENGVITSKFIKKQNI